MTDWKRMRFKKNKVWVALGPDGQPDIQAEKVLIKYQLNQDHEYRIHPNSLHPLGGPDQIESAAPAATPTAKKEPRCPAPPKAAAGQIEVTQPDDAIIMHTDGACSGNPGPAGIGVLMQYGQHEKEISRFIGIATNNIAELEAIRTGLKAVKNREKPVRIYTDSSYAFGLITKGWKAKKNPELVAEIRKLSGSFSDIRYYKVKGHAGDPGNERADELATEAIKQNS
jgi:ribonuclease HI